MNLKKEADKLYPNLEEREVDGKLEYYKAHRVYPIINKDGSINWFNFITGGTYKKLLIIIFITLVTLGLIFEYTSNLKIGAECLAKQHILFNITNITLP